MRNGRFIANSDTAQAFFGVGMSVGVGVGVGLDVDVSVGVGMGVGVGVDVACVCFVCVWVDCVCACVSVVVRTSGCACVNARVLQVFLRVCPSTIASRPSPTILQPTPPPSIPYTRCRGLPLHIPRQVLLVCRAAMHRVYDMLGGGAG